LTAKVWVKKRRREMSSVLPASTVVWFLLLFLRSGDCAFSSVGLDMGHYDQDKLEQQIHSAAAFGANILSFSSDIVMDAYEILKDPKKADTIDNLCATAKGLGMPVYLWNHQIEDPPASVLINSSKTLDFDSPDLWRFLTNESQQLIAAVPHCEGIVLSLTEAKWQVQRDDGTIHSSLSPTERVEKLVTFMANVLNQTQHKLIVRDFFRTPAEMAMFLSVMNAGTVPLDIPVYSKNIANDFHYSYPPNPNLGLYQGRQNLFEIEPGDVAGDGWYWQKQVALALSKGMSGYLPRIHNVTSSTGGKHVFERFSWLISMDLAKQPDLDVKAWATGYWKSNLDASSSATDVMLELTASHFALKCNISYTLGQWIQGNADSIPTISKSDSHLDTRERSLWSNSPADSANEKLLRAGGAPAIAAALVQKEAAVAFAQNAIDRLDKVKGDIKNDYKYVVEFYDSAMWQARNFIAWTKGYLGMRAYRNDPTDPDALDFAKQCVGDVNTFLKDTDSKNVLDGMKDFLKSLQKIVPDS